MYNSYYRNPEIPNNDFINTDVALQVNCAGFETNKNGLNASSRRKDIYLFYLFEGEIEITSPVKAELHSGDIFIFEPHKNFSYRSKDKSCATHYFVHFTGNKAFKLLDSCGLLFFTVYKMKSPPVQEFEDLFRTFLNRDIFFETDSMAKLISLITAIGRQNRQNGCKVNEYETRLYRSLEFLHNNFTGDITVSELAEIENLSESRYRALFSSVMKCSPSEYISNLRMNLACSLLSSRDMSIEEIAEASGYSDPHYFSRIFKKKLNLTPTEYKKRFKA